jgi:5'-nucleotidase
VAHSDFVVTRSMDSAGESLLGDVVADAQRAVLHTDVSLMNAGGLRVDLPAGRITWGDILSVHPFNNHVLVVSMTGAQLLQALEEQWSSDPAAIPRILKTSGLYYEWDPARPAGSHIVRACDAQLHTLQPTVTYRVAVNDFLMGGGDDFKTFGTLPVDEVGPVDAEALESYLKSEHGEVERPVGPRIFVTGGAAQLRCSDPVPQPTSSP